MTILPGRLGNPAATLVEDPRLDARLKETLAAYELAPGLEPPGMDASYEDALAYCAAFEKVNEQAHPLLLEAMPEFPNVSSKTVEISGVDGNQISLYIDQPSRQDGPLPCIVTFFIS